MSHTLPVEIQTTGATLDKFAATATAIKRLKTFRKRPLPQGETIQEMRAEGRR